MEDDGMISCVYKRKKERKDGMGGMAETLFNLSLLIRHPRLVVLIFLVSPILGIAKTSQLLAPQNVLFVNAYVKSQASKCIYISYCYGQHWRHI